MTCCHVTDSHRVVFYPEDDVTLEPLAGAASVGSLGGACPYCMVFPVIFLPQSAVIAEVASISV